MTLICGIKGKDNFSTVITDFRLTNTSNGKQYDSGLKYIQHNNSLVIFMAGTVTILGEIKKALEENNSTINIDSIDNPNSIIFNIITDVFSKQTELNSSNNSSFIVICLDNNKKRHKMFSFDINYYSKHWKIENLINDSVFTWKTIGAGKIIEDKAYFGSRWDYDLKKVFDNLMDKSNNNIYAASFGIKTIISSRIDSLKEKAKNEPTNPLYTNFQEPYKKLGVSPTFFRAEIQKDKFYFVLEKIETTTVKDGKIEESHYSFVKGNDCEIELHNEVDNPIIKTYKTTNENINKLTNQKTFDPDRKES